MNKGICNVSVAPVRADKTDKAEIVTEILYGESADILEAQSNWTKIKMHYDGYEGWMDTKQISPVEDDFLAKRKTHLITEPFQSRVMETGKILLSMGSEVSFETIHAQRGATVRQSIVETAKEFLNVPYLWGGKSFFGVDCSGFTQLVLKVHDIKIPRDAYQQGEVGEPLSFIEEAQPGDLAFFENSEGRIIHVGFMLENSQIIHAHGKVRIDTLDSSGIFNKEQNRHTHKLRFIRNILG
ncbi:hydrolase Nlp/P60 [Elizabethkingia meningoseptica]|uniref:C40 family peptidase n=1 Tax=Elizabethkingia meningoseptica TaxID=238 RepID=UPI000332CD5B|nr:C40 family peptidase [Elizabethkingia meningoseptica]AQX04084.1 hydrolase Nlp/P60 [Elizabethkingia meningoseptica]AQX46125.1 hydrolase Nlp/P60 [Elizabethkingia meningoseptica]EOR30499.1 NLP/P60 protein [Elizabethkingia meningoseptica ATCC 13253 = NBRC 12535]KUY15417.1 hydrolase Nlp/P60 [Elizabethkingia meningoseptica]OPB69211.1 hydrolase Nlp/P60 [Elizabethkingia meningoseptica]